MLFAIISETTWWWLSRCLALLASYALFCGYYNLYLHPLSKFPGPKLAAIGRLYEFWFDVVLDGRFIHQIGKMHEKYGPIVRINSRELHIYDPYFYNSIYASGLRKVDKDAATTRAFSLSGCTPSTVEHDRHRQRRGFLNPSFSKRAIVALEPLIHERTSKLCDRLEEISRTQEPVTLDAAFASLTADIICQYLYGDHFNYLAAPNFENPITSAVHGLSLGYHLARFIPLAPLLKILPVSVVDQFSASAAGILHLRSDMRQKFQKILDHSETMDAGTLLSALTADRVPREEKTMDRLLDEGTALLFAGTDTTSKVLSVAMFHLFHKRPCLEELREELDALPFKADNEYSLAELEHLSYLTAVIQESLRLTFGLVGRFPRVSCVESLQYKDFIIPPGTPVSQAAYFVHTDPQIYPSPFSFEPERWIKAAQEGVNLQQHLVSFTKGSRQCIGIPLAFAQLYLVIVKLVRTLDMELYETTPEDVTCYRVRLFGYPKHAKYSGGRTRGVRVTITYQKCIE
ncbi:hypothetical protein H634G_02590 [Metarhizium anisopliae BRIP 53293]|uniref:Trichodiene oxygenase n=1 Tax=Metarhizium anisopliae BRIP 53293 TaxID=1291518 RepID=A0A0D9P8G7_METAN|nr:hypothetical protein H634G_02590 [Metarhizium anisopliae BRIP 53293]